MTKIKLCGLTRECDIETVNALGPEYVGFVFYERSRRYVSPEQALKLKRLLRPEIQAVGVFVREEPERIAKLLESGVIDIAQLHGGEDEAYVGRLRELTDRPFIQAFRIDSEEDVLRAGRSPADFVLLDSGTGGTGTSFDWGLIRGFSRPYFLAGGLDADTVSDAVRELQPYGVDVSSGIETDGVKDPEKMRQFVEMVRAGSSPDFSQPASGADCSM